MKCDAEHWRDVVAAVECGAFAGDEVSDFEAEAEAAGGSYVNTAAEAASYSRAASVGGDGLVWPFDRDLFVSSNQAQPSGGYQRYAAGAGMGETEAGRYENRFGAAA